MIITLCSKCNYFSRMMNNDFCAQSQKEKAGKISINSEAL